MQCTRTEHTSNKYIRLSIQARHRDNHTKGMQYKMALIAH